MCIKEMMAASRLKSDKAMLFLFPLITFVLFAGAAFVYWLLKLGQQNGTF